MTELEKMKHARDYIDLLARGIDPITGKEVPEDTVLNNFHLSNCFSYVSEVLGRIIDNGGQVTGTAHAGGGPAPFTVDATRLADIPVSDESVTITVLARNISSAVDTAAMKPLSAVRLADLLQGEGLLAEETVNGKKRRVPADKGIAIGITCSEGINRQGMPFRINLYSRAAQQRIIAMLPELLSGQAAQDD